MDQTPTTPEYGEETVIWYVDFIVDSWRFSVSRNELNKNVGVSAVDNVNTRAEAHSTTTDAPTRIRMEKWWLEYLFCDSDGDFLIDYLLYGQSTWQGSIAPN